MCVWSSSIRNRQKKIPCNVSLFIFFRARRGLIIATDARSLVIGETWNKFDTRKNNTNGKKHGTRDWNADSVKQRPCSVVQRRLHSKLKTSPYTRSSKYWHKHSPCHSLSRFRHELLSQLPLARTGMHYACTAKGVVYLCLDVKLPHFFKDIVQNCTGVYLSEVAQTISLESVVTQKG